MNNQTTTTKMMSQKVFVWCLTLALLAGATIPPSQAQTQDRTARDTTRTTGRRGHAVNSFRAAPGQNHPLWVERALQRSFTHLAQRNQAAQHESQGEMHRTTDPFRSLREPQSELALVAAEQDDFGQTHVRLNQVQQGVEVFGGQLVTHLEADAVRDVTGRVFDTSGSETTATLPAEQAIALAKAALHYGGDFAAPPTAKLVVLPHRISTGDDQQTGATLTWQVALKVEDGTDTTGEYQYFINAQDGQVVWHYNALAQDTFNITQPGRSLYSGQVMLNTQNEATPTQRFFATGNYNLVDGLRNNSLTKDMKNSETGESSVFSVFFTALARNYTWGNGREAAAVDAHFGLANVWDYFRNTFKRNGIDNTGKAVTNRVHYGTNYNNATYSNYTVTIGDGDGQRFSPLASLDIIAHEFTHGVTGQTAGLIYAGESGALNEGFSDIFGTAAEFYANIRPNYLIGEDAYTPGIKGDALRNMADPTKQGQPDHYTMRAYAGACVPDNNPKSPNYNDNCGVHTNSGIINKAFYLLSEGGLHPYSQVSVGGIGRARAEWIFYRALTKYLTASASFSDARQATIRAAQDGQVQMGYRAWVAEEVAMAWDAVGVSGDVVAGYYVLQAKNSGLVANVPGNSTESGTLLQQAVYDNLINHHQHWKIEPVGNGYYRLLARHRGLAMNVSGASTANGANFIQGQYVGADNDRFKIAPVGDGYYMIVAKHSGKVLDVAGASSFSGAHLIQWDYWGGDNQKWKLIPVQ